MDPRRAYHQQYAASSYSSSHSSTSSSANYQSPHHRIPQGWETTLVGPAPLPATPYMHFIPLPEDTGRAKYPQNPYPSPPPERPRPVLHPILRRGAISFDVDFHYRDIRILPSVTHTAPLPFVGSAAEGELAGREGSSDSPAFYSPIQYTLRLPQLPPTWDPIVIIEPRSGSGISTGTFLRALWRHLTEEVPSSEMRKLNSHQREKVHHAMLTRCRKVQLDQRKQDVIRRMDFLLGNTKFMGVELPSPSQPGFSAAAWASQLVVQFGPASG